jgi:hypothetical protein
MAKQLHYIDQEMLDRMVGHKDAIKWENDNHIFIARPELLDIIQEHDKRKNEKIELISSPRPVPRDHLKRDLKSMIEDLETVTRHLGYMLEEL